MQDVEEAGAEGIDSAILDEVILLSHRLGDKTRDWVIPGEGSVSIRLDDSTFAITADAASLGQLGAGDLIVLCFAPLLDAVVGEGALAPGEAEELLLSARRDDTGLQPPAAAFAHAYLLTLPDVLLVGQTHPESIAGLLCSAHGWQQLQQGGRLTPDEVRHCGVAPCCVPFARPGIELARALRDMVEAFQEAYLCSPRTIYLQNQGFIALGGLAQEVERTTAMADKASRIMARAAASGAPAFLAPQTVLDLARPEYQDVIEVPATAPAGQPAHVSEPSIEQPPALPNEAGAPPALDLAALPEFEKTDKMPVADVMEPDLDESVLDENDLDAAIDHAGKQVARWPKNPRAHYNLGLALLRKERIEESVECLCQAVLLNPHDVDANVNLGIALAQKRSWDEAIAQFDAAIALAPNDPSIHYNLGWTYLTMGQTDQAIALFTESIRLEPRDLDTHTGLGSAFLLKGWLDKAVAEFSAALLLDRNSSEAHYRLGTALARLAKAGEAIVHYQEALRLGLKTADIHAELGDAYRRDKQLDQAIGEYQEALFLDPEHLEAYCGFGNVLFEKGLKGKPGEYWDTSRDAYQRALSINPIHAPSLTGLGILEAKLGNTRAAIEVLEAAIEADPGYAPANDALKKLKKQQGTWREAWLSRKNGPVERKEKKSAAR